MEQIVLADYLARWYRHITHNYTIKGWEIDLIVHDDKELVFVEVKSVDLIDDIHDYITPGKKSALNKTIQSYLRTNNIDQDYRLDVVFVRRGEIIERYEGVEI